MLTTVVYQYRTLLNTCQFLFEDAVRWHLIALFTVVGLPRIAKLLQMRALSLNSLFDQSILKSLQSN
jgi:hypothetical protein